MILIVTSLVVVVFLAVALQWRTARDNRRLREELREAAAELESKVQAEKALAEREAVWHAVFGNAPCAIAIHRLPDGAYLEVNPVFERSMGLRSTDVVGKTPYEFMSAEERQEQRLLLQRLVETGRIDNCETTMRKPDGSVFEVLYSAATFQAGGQLRAVSLAVDITKRKQAEAEVRRLNEQLEHRVNDRTAQLQAANKELEAFSYSVSHDLRSPLRHITGFLKLLNSHAGTTLDAEGVRLLTTVDGAAKRMGFLIDDLLTFSRVGRAQMRVAPLSMSQLVEECRQELAPDVKNRNIEWVIPALPEVMGDRSMLKQVWVNLLGNAVKYTRRRAEARIELGHRSVDGEWQFFVRDNGMGFNMKYVNKLFGVFQRLHSDAEIEGTGIGLANVRRIVLRHGGRTWAEGEVGRGAVFFFSLPKAGPTLEH